MIQKIRITNFQAHETLEVDFEKITTIVGPTDAGKSSIIRALGWVCLNQPSGDEFIRWGAKKCSVSVWVDGNVITRVRGSGENYYKLNKKVFKSFGQGQVPDPIKNLLGITEYHFQYQLDPHLWFAESPAQVSRKLNDLVNLKAIDESIKLIGAEVRSANERVKFTMERKKSATDRINELRGVPQMVKDWELLAEKIDEQAKLKTTCQNLASLVEGLSDMVQVKKATGRASQEGKTLVLAHGEYQEVQTRAASLERLVSKIEACEKILKSPVPDIGKLVLLRSDGNRHSERRRTLELLLEDLEKAITKREATQTALSEAVNDLNLKIGDKCPLCQKPISSAPSASLTSTCQSKHLGQEPRKKTLGSKYKKPT